MASVSGCRGGGVKASAPLLTQEAGGSVVGTAVQTGILREGAGHEGWVGGHDVSRSDVSMQTSSDLSGLHRSTD